MEEGEGWRRERGGGRRGVEEGEGGKGKNEGTQVWRECPLD